MSGLGKRQNANLSLKAKQFASAIGFRTGEIGTQ